MSPGYRGARKLSRRFLALVAAVAAGSVVLVGCTPGHARVDAKAAARQPHSASRATLNGTELHYGAGFREKYGSVLRNRRAAAASASAASALVR